MIKLKSLKGNLFLTFALCTIVFSCAFLFSACGDNKGTLKDISITQTQDFYAGDTFDKSKFQVVAIYSKKNINIDIDDSNLSFSEVDTSLAGVKSLVVKYKNVSKSINVTIKDLIPTEDNIVILNNVKYKIINQDSAIVVGAISDKITDISIQPQVTKNNMVYNVTAIDNCAFSCFSKLQNVRFEENSKIPFALTAFGEEVFADCVNLSSINIPNCVQSIDFASFYNCTSLENITLPNKLREISFSVFADCTSLNNLVIPNSVLNIRESAFCNCKGLKNITFGNSIKNIGFDAFSRCKNIENVYADSVESWCAIEFDEYSSNPLNGGAKLFINGEEVNDLIIPNSVSKINSNAFYGCLNLTSVVVENGVASIGGNAFRECKNIHSINIADSVTSLGYSAFNSCSKLLNITLSKNIVSIGDFAFEATAWYNGLENGLAYLGNYLIGCKNYLSVTDLVIKDGTKLIANGAFNVNSDLITVTIPNSVEIIGVSAFSDCENLKTVVFGDGIKTISDKAFYFCKALTTITIGSGLKNLNNCSFCGCTALETINYNGTMEQWQKINKADGAFESNVGNVIHCTDGDFQKQILN